MRKQILISLILPPQILKVLNSIIAGALIEYFSNFVADQVQNLINLKIVLNNFEAKEIDNNFLNSGNKSTKRNFKSTNESYIFYLSFSVQSKTYFDSIFPFLKM